MRLKPSEADELYGRLLEAQELHERLESGEITSLEEMLQALKARNAVISASLAHGELIDGKPVSACQRELIRAQIEAAEPDVVIH